MQRSSFKTLLVAAVMAVILAGCGGGGDGGPATTSGGAVTPPQPAGKQLTGKAIDGYLANAKVCFDDGQGGCDASLPMTTTDAAGAYTLNAPVDATGRQINVIVTPETIDLSTGEKFISTFTLSAIVGGATQNITPLTTMVVSQLKAGASPEQALQTTQAFAGTAVDPNADYIANGDKATATMAASMISHMTGLNGQGGPISWSQVQATMKAYAYKGGIDAVQQADINKQLTDPAYSTEANATTVLGSPLYTVDGHLMKFIPGSLPDSALSPVRENFTLSGNTLSITQEVQSNGAWLATDAPGSYDAGLSSSWISLNEGDGAYEMKTDGAWSAWLTAGQMHPSYTLSSVGSTLVGTDPNTGDVVRVSYRTLDVSNQSLASGLQIDYRNPVRRAMRGSFAAGTTAYLSTATYNNDRLILVNKGFGLPWINGQTVFAFNYVNGSARYTLGDPVVMFTSVQQAVGTQTDIGGGCVLLNIKAAGVAELDKSNKEGCNYANNPLQFPVTGSWSVYPRNPEVITINLPKSVGSPLVPINDRIKNVINAGGSLVVGLLDSKLVTGYMQPATVPTTVAQFRADVVETITASMRAAASMLGQSQHP